MAAGLFVGDVFRNASRAVPDREAAVFGDASTTFGDLESAADRIAQALLGAGVSAGSRVACWTGTSLDAPPLFAALALLGAVYAPLAPAWSVDEAHPVAELVAPDLLVVDAAHGESGGELAARLGVPAVALTALLAAEDVGRLPRAQIAETDPHVVFFTSGSTGRPKGAVLSHRVHYLRTHPGGQLEPHGTSVCTFPLFHMAGWTISLQQWQARSTVVYLDRPDGPTVVEAVRRHSAERLYCIPAVWQRVLDELAGGTLPTLRFADTGTSATPPALLAAIRAACPNAHVRVFYGSTEAGNVCSLDDADIEARPLSCGLPSPATELTFGDGGELLVRGPQLFDGYFRDPEATSAALTGGWFHTGDVARADDDGYLYVVGRLGEVIRTGGEVVAPVEVEAVLATVPGVREVAVVGLPDEAWGEVVCAVVVPDDPLRVPSLEDLRAACAGRLAPHKHPRTLRLCDALPRTAATGQVQRRSLVELLGS